MASISFGTKIASMRGAVTEKNVRRQMWTVRQTAFQLYIYDNNIFNIVMNTVIIVKLTGLMVTALLE